MGGANFEKKISKIIHFFQKNSPAASLLINKNSVISENCKITQVVGHTLKLKVFMHPEFRCYFFTA